MEQIVILHKRNFLEMIIYLLINIKIITNKCNKLLQHITLIFKGNMYIKHPPISVALNKPFGFSCN